MKQLERTYVTEKQFRHKQSQEGAKFTHKIHKIAIDTSRAHHDALTYTMTHYTKLFKGRFHRAGLTLQLANPRLRDNRSPVCVPSLSVNVTAHLTCDLASFR